MGNRCNKGCISWRTEQWFFRLLEQNEIFTIIIELSELYSHASIIVILIKLSPEMWKSAPAHTKILFPHLETGNGLKIMAI